MLILPNTDNNGVAFVGEKIRCVVEALAVAHAHTSAGRVVTVSTSTTGMVPMVKEGAELLQREADSVLYRFKRPAVVATGRAANISIKYTNVPTHRSVLCPSP